MDIEGEAAPGAQRIPASWGAGPTRGPLGAQRTRPFSLWRSPPWRHWVLSGSKGLGWAAWVRLGARSSDPRNRP